MRRERGGNEIDEEIKVRFVFVEGFYFAFRISQVATYIFTNEFVTAIGRDSGLAERIFVYRFRTT